MLWSYQLTKFYCLIAFTSWDIGNVVIIIICYIVYDVTKFEINFSFLIKPFPYINKKSAQKYKYLKNKKSF